MSVSKKYFSVIMIISIFCAAIVGCKTKVADDTTQVETESTDTAGAESEEIEIVVLPEAEKEIPDESKKKEGVKETKKTPKETTTVVVKRVPLTLIVKNLQSPTAPVTIGVYGTENKFPDPKDQLKEYVFKPKSGQLIVKVKDLPYGIYALAIYQDENSNGKIDKNFLGIPTEHYAFSNNYKPTVKAPAFKDCQFTYSATTSSVTMTLIK
jgi:uncharacterized protein (DUF2141 family)